MSKTYSITKLIRARIVLASPEGGGGAQNVSVFYGKELTGEELKNYVSEKHKPLTLPGVLESKITIIKQDATTKKRLQGIGLVLYSEEAKGYVKKQWHKSAICIKHKRCNRIHNKQKWRSSGRKTY